ncbi:P-II family nitrogen regulator [Aliifodinibius salicampi]|uniref:P-II family nitrogen regulator n=1 Tax=Fodinibius salicampi TaxID=1920655 RepID=A0ABT3Q2P3_9BACT|nr:P-II family nitrogen regulator [Fodinibius salicampi]MCW9714379.1 P-II family nitrogen regulator [Fodinibius salicampi]
MKLVIAIIRETQLDEVREALIEAEIRRITVMRVSGHGKAEDVEIYRGKKVVPGLIPRFRLEIAVNDEFVDVTVDTIIKTVKSRYKDKNPGKTTGDGKIFITPLEECIRISTEERGSAAI